MKNIITFLSLGLLGLVLALNGCGGDSVKTNPAMPAIPGASTFKKYCTACHGADGKMGLNGAKDLTASALTQEERVQIITNGRKLMAPYKSILSAEEINDVATYVGTLKE